MISKEDPFTDSIFVTQAGRYTIGWSLDECLFSAQLQLNAMDCQAHIYLPNAFSPNGDGINDRVYPLWQSQEIEALDFVDLSGCCSR